MSAILPAPYFQSPSVTLASITPKASANGQLAFDLGLSVHNPNPILLPVDTISSQIALNGFLFLFASGVSEKVIPAGGDDNVTLSANLGLAQIKQLISTLHSPNIDYDLSGNANVTGTILCCSFRKRAQLTRLIWPLN